MVSRIFSWLAGLALVLVFFVIIAPDVFRGYIFSTEERSSGRRVYDVYCIGCHGTEGKGDGPAAEFLNPKPRNFVNEDYKFFHFGEPPPLPLDESLEITVRNGVPGSSMPAHPLLADQEIKDVVTYIKSLREGGWQEVAELQVATGGVMLEGETGEEIYVNAGCNACHQLDALGSVGGVGPAHNDVGARLSLEEMIVSIVDPDADVAENCPAGPCPAGVMPKNFGERLTSEQVLTLVQFLAEQQ